MDRNEMSYEWRNSMLSTCNGPSDKSNCYSFTIYNKNKSTVHIACKPLLKQLSIRQEFLQEENLNLINVKQDLNDTSKILFLKDNL